jgi:hypothetical protein
MNVEHKAPRQTILAASDDQLDLDLAARLRALESAESTPSDYFAPLGAIVVEAVAWLAAASSLWIAAAVWARR